MAVLEHRRVGKLSARNGHSGSVLKAGIRRAPKETKSEVCGDSGAKCFNSRPDPGLDPVSIFAVFTDGLKSSGALCLRV